MYVYVAVAGFIITLVFLVLVYTMSMYDVPETLAFSIIDDLRIYDTEIVDDSTSLDKIFTEKDFGDDWKILNKAVDVSITLK